MPRASAAATHPPGLSRPPGPLLHSSWGAWGRAWPPRRVEELPAPLLVQLSRLDCERMGAGAQTVADAVRRLGAAGALSPVVVAYLLRINDLDTRRRRARHTGRRPTELERVVHDLAAAGVDPATPLTKPLCSRFSTNRSTLGRALVALATGQFRGGPA